MGSTDPTSIEDSGNQFIFKQNNDSMMNDTTGKQFEGEHIKSGSISMLQMWPQSDYNGRLGNHEELQRTIKKRDVRIAKLE